MKSKPLAKAFSISLLNQAVSSGTNFALGLFLVRALTPTEFGVYGIGFAICLFYSGIGNALFLTQMVVHTHEKAEADREPYAARILSALTIFCLITALLVILFIESVTFITPIFNQYSNISISIAAAAIGYLTKDFFVRYAYTAKKEIWALFVNIMVAVTLVSLMAFQYYFGALFSSQKALWYFATSNFAGAIIGFIITQLPMRSVKLGKIVEDTKEVWHGGRWAIGGVSVIWAQTQSYNYVTALFLGPAGVGYANAARMMITPFLMLTPAINQVTMPRLAEYRAKDKSKMFKMGFTVTMLQLIGSSCYIAFILFASATIIPIMVGNKYQNLKPLILGWSMVLILQLLRDGAATLLQAMKLFRIITLVNTVSAVAAILSSVVLMKYYGVVGAIIATGIGELLLAIMLWLIVVKERREFLKEALTK